MAGAAYIAVAGHHDLENLASLLGDRLDGAVDDTGDANNRILFWLSIYRGSQGMSTS